MNSESQRHNGKHTKYISYETLPKYFIQNSIQTLSEALEEYYIINPEYRDSDGFLGQPQCMITAHDVVHVLYGLGVSSKEELLVETATAVGCYTTLEEMKTFKPIHFTASLLDYFGPYRLVKRFILTTPAMIKMSMNCLQQKKRWNHGGYEAYLHTPLRKIREQYGIRVWY